MGDYQSEKSIPVSVNSGKEEIAQLKRRIRTLTEERDLWRQRALKSNGSILRYRAIFENTGTATILIEADFTISACNLKFAQLVGLPQEEIEGQVKWPQFIHPHDLAAMKAYHNSRRIRSDAAPKSYEFRLIDHRRKMHHILITIDMVPESLQSVASLMDITDRIQAETALKASKEKYRLLVETMNDGLAIQDPTGVLIYLNPRACAMLGYPENELVGRTPIEFIAPESMGVWHQQMALRKKGGHQPYEIVWRNKQGQRIHTLVSPRALFDDQRNFVGSFAILTDITVYKRTSEALRLSEEMFSKAFRASPSSTFIATLENRRIINVNDSFLKHTGYGLFEVIGKSIPQINLFADAAQIEHIVTDITQKGRVKQLEIGFYTKAKALRHGVMSAERIQLWQESCILASFEDVTESRNLQLQILQISTRERHRIGRVLHDDLCPHLIGIDALSNVLLRQLNGERHQSMALMDKVRKLIQGAIDKTRRLSHGLCPTHLVDSGINAGLTDLADQIRTVHGISCEFVSTTNLTIDDEDTVGHIFYIVQEAALNAVKHANCRRIEIRLTKSDHLSLLQIIDDGCGISNPSRSNGMGLSLMKFRATVIGARLEIKDQEGRGTEIRLLLEDNSNR